jgi:DNA-binding CsgD family transcriptional regulator
MSDPFAERDFREIFRELPGVAVMIVRADGMFEYANEAVSAIYEFPPTETPVGRRLADLLNPEFVAERLELIDRTLATKRPLIVDHLFRGRPITATFFPLYGDDGVGRVLIISRHRSPHDVDPGTFERVRSRVMDLGVLSKLSQRELEVFVLLGHGMSVPEVAARLKRSPKTIEQHKAAIGRKLGDSTLSGIARAVAEIGIDEEHLRARAIDVFRTGAKDAP